MDSLEDLKTRMQSMTEAINRGDLTLTDGDKKVLMAACDELKAAVESPVDRVSKLAFATHQSTAVRIAMEMGIFNAMAEVKGGSMSADDLEARTGAEKLLIVRIMRILTGMKIFHELQEHQYSAAPISRAFVQGSPLGAALAHFHDVHGSVLVKLPEYFASKGFKSPDDALSGPFQYAFGTKLHHFDWLKEHPKHLNDFNSLMTAQRQGRGEEWFEFFPVDQKISWKSTAEEAPTLLVDIGGGLGYDLAAFRARHPSAAGKLVLQELPETAAQVKDLPADMHVMAHNFFEVQPIQGARAYYLRTILHDWPDKEARKILRNILPAMSKDSLLLINEYVLPDCYVPLFPAQLDLSMMCMFSSMERTAQQWDVLLRSAGFELIKIWTPQAMEVGFSSLIEARASKTM